MALNHSWEYKESEGSYDLYQCDDCKLVVYKPDFLTLEQALYYEGILSLCLGRIMEVSKVEETKVYDLEYEELAWARK